MGVAEIDQWSQSGLGYLVTGQTTAQQPEPSGNQASLTGWLTAVADGEPAIQLMPLPEASDSGYRQPDPDTLGPALVSEREARGLVDCQLLGH